MDTHLVSRFAGRFVGVVPPAAFETLWYPKQLLLMFDCLAIDLGQRGLSQQDTDILQNSMGEIRWLIDSDMLTLLSGLTASNATAPTARDLAHARKTMQSNKVAFERLNALELRKKGIDAVPLTRSPDRPGGADSVADRDTVIRITLNAFPAPNDMTPWESVESFRKDPSARAKFSQLKRWMNKVGDQGLKEYDVADELRGLIDDCQSHMKIHGMKSRTSVFEAFITVGTAIVDDLPIFKLSNIAKNIFSVRKQKITLLEDELKMPGKEVAYLVDAWKNFPS